jgi:hypothetical protein
MKTIKNVLDKEMPALPIILKCKTLMVENFRLN